MDIILQILTAEGPTWWEKIIILIVSTYGAVLFLASFALVLIYMGVEHLVKKLKNEQGNP